MLRAQERLTEVVPYTLVIIFILLYLIFRRAGEAFLVMLSLPFALVGGFWFVYLLGYNLSVAVAVGFIALAGVAGEFGVIMLVYLDNALKERREEGRLHSVSDLKAAMSCDQRTSESGDFWCQRDQQRSKLEYGEVQLMQLVLDIFVRDQVAQLANAHQQGRLSSPFFPPAQCGRASCLGRPAPTRR